MKKFKLLISMMLIFVMVFSAVGCSSTPAEEPQENGAPADTPAAEGGEAATTGESKEKDSLIVAINIDIESLDPTAHLQVLSSFVTESIYDTLYIPDVDGNPIPQIAESHEYITDTQLQIKIHEGIKFHDGSEMKAEDVQASLLRAQASKKAGKYYKEIESIDIIDDYTVQINLTQPYIPFLIALAHHSAAILPKAYIDSEPDFTAPIGSGAYKFVSWTSGDSVVMERNDDYFDKDNMSPFGEVTFRVIPEGTSRTIALEAGEVDVAYALDSIDYNRVADTSGLQTYKKDVNGTSYLFFNVEKAPFDDLNFRKAFNYVVNKEAVNIVANNGLATIMHNVTASHFLGYNEEVRYDYNPEKAKELFAEAGFTADDTITLSVYDDVSKRIAEVIQGNMMDIGLNMDIEIVEWGKYIENTGNGNFEMAILGWNQASDPDRYFSQLLHSSQIDGQNRARYSNPELDKLIDAGRIEGDLAKREEIYHEAYKMVMEDAPWVPLYIRSNLVGATDDLDLSKAISAEGSFYFNFIDVK